MLFLLSTDAAFNVIIYKGNVFVCLVDNYDKGEVKEQEDMLPCWFSQQAVYMKVSSGSKIRNLMTYAMKRINVIIDLHVLCLKIFLIFIRLRCANSVWQ